MNKEMLKEVTAVLSKYPMKSEDTFFLMLYNGESDSFTGTPVYGTLFTGKHDIREEM